MFKIVIVIMTTSLLGGHGTGSFSSEEVFDTLKECERVRELAVPALVRSVQSRNPGAVISADSECVVATDALDPYDRISDILSQMNRRGGFGVVRP